MNDTITSHHGDASHLDRLRRPRILLVEDNPADADLVRLALSETELFDGRLETCDSLRGALELLESGRKFGAILLDLSLPDSRGFETLRRLLERFPDNNVIVLTGVADRRLGVAAVRAGAQDFLAKDRLDADQLDKSLRFSIERSRVLKRLEETQRIARIGNWEYQPATDRVTLSDTLFRIFDVQGIPNTLTLAALVAENPVFRLLERAHEQTGTDVALRRDYQIRLRDNRLRYLTVRCQLDRDGGGRYAGVVQDITERKEAERAVTQSRERYEAIFNKSKDAIYIATLEGRMEHCNDATLRLFGYSQADLMAVEDIHAQLYYPQGRVNEFLLKLKAQRSIKDFEIEVVHRNKEVRYCLISANLQISDNFAGYNGIVRDITERKQAEKLRKARDLTARTAKMKEQFIASVSHEMRTPMNAILGMSNLLAKMDLAEEPRELVGSIKQSSEILLGIVNDILEISTIQNGKVIFDHKPFELRTLLKNLVQVMRYKAQEKALQFEVILDEAIPAVLVGDPLRLNQILYNLVGNAIKFTDRGFVKIYGKKLYDIGDSVQLKFIVEDTGIGIPADKVEAVFESFTRVRTKERIYEGTGLGLAIVKNLVEQQGGKAGATSKLGEGAKFYFDLIFERGEAAALVEPAAAEDAFDPATPFRLLLVEDHKMNQLVARKTLQKQFPNVALTIANHGKEAIEILANNDFDIVLMDIQMPLLDGYETTALLRKMRPSVAQLPVLAMTAHANVAKDKKYLDHQMNDYVLKPFDPDNLFRKIGQYVSAARF